jgi:quercetin dioxygenase-like cupin family protein
MRTKSDAMQREKAHQDPNHHRRSAFVYAYVIPGAIEAKVNDGETRIYLARESWSEPPGATHSISRNASKTEPAKLLAVFVLDTNDNPLTTTHQIIPQTH